MHAIAIEQSMQKAANAALSQLGVEPAKALNSPNTPIDKSITATNLIMEFTKYLLKFA